MSQYKIGQLAKTMGVSTHLLKHYEKFGLVQPIIDRSTNYRYYDIGQCSRILESKMYRNLGFSLNEIVDLMNQDSNVVIEDKVKKQILHLETQLQEIIIQKHMAETFLAHSNEFDQRRDEWLIEYCPDMILLKQSNERSLIEQTQEESQIFHFVKELPLTCSALYLYQDTFQTDYLHYHWGVIQHEDNIDKVSDCYHKFPSTRCFCTYIAVEAPYMDNRRLVDLITKQYECLAPQITQDVLAIRYKVVHENQKEIHCFKVYVPLTHA